MQYLFVKTKYTGLKLSWQPQIVNGVIRAENSLLFFYEKILHTPKAQKSTKKHQKHKMLQVNSKGMVVPLNQ